MSNGMRQAAGRQLRTSSMLRRPGRYSEDDGPINADHPIFVHPDIPFNPTLTAHCAHPSLPLDFPGRGPAEIERERQIVILRAQVTLKQARRAAEAEARVLAGEGDNNDEGQSGSEYGEAGGAGEAGWQAPSVRWHDWFVARELVQQQEANGADKEGNQAVEGEGPNGLPAELGDLSLDHPSRPAHVVTIRKRDAMKYVTKDADDEEQEILDENPWIDSSAKTTPVSSKVRRGLSPQVTTSHLKSQSDTNQYPCQSVNAPRPKWSDLPNSIKWAIIHDVSGELKSFTRTTSALNLIHDEVISFLRLVGKERIKNDKVLAILSGDPTRFDVSGIDKIVQRPKLTPVTNIITAADVRLGRAYLKDLGFENIAANLGAWEGMGGEFHDIPLNHLAEDGLRGLLSQMNMFGDETVRRLLRANNQHIRRHTPREIPLVPVSDPTPVVDQQPIPPFDLMSKAEILVYQQVHLRPPQKFLNPRVHMMNGVDPVDPNDGPEPGVPALMDQPTDHFENAS